MKHKIHTFRASTMDEAMDLVHRELGKDAIIVDSKEVATRRLIPWPSTRQEIEVSAERVRNSSSSKKSLVAHAKPAPMPRVIRTLAESTLATDVIASELASIPDPVSESVSESLPNREQIGSPPAWLVNEAKSRPTIDRIKPDDVESSASSIMTETPSAETDSRLTSIQTLVSLLQMHSRSRGVVDVPNEYMQQYVKLVEAGIDEEVAREMITTLPRPVMSDSLDSQADAATVLTAYVEREMRCAPPIQPQSGRREIVTLIGPTGVGKTTTLAKLAGHFQLREGRRVGLIAVDHFRVGAFDQLRTYAEILQAPLRSATTSDELRVAIDSLNDVDVILIDTAGRGPMDRTKMDELREIVRVAASDHVLLVMSLAGGATNLSKIARQFAAARPTSLVISKLDEAVGCGGLLSIAREVPFPISYVTMGQDVPDQIEPANANRLARLILGCDQLAT